MNAGERILVLGGARAGKSAYALQLAHEQQADASRGVCFIATAEAYDDDMRDRIARHRTERPSQWRTFEEPRFLDKAFGQTPDADVVIIDCLTLFVSNWLLAVEPEPEAARKVYRILDRVLTAAAQSSRTLIMVSNEAGLGVVPPTPLGRVFRDLLGRVNQRVAKDATQVYLMIAGLPIELKPDSSSTPFGRRA